MASRFIRTRIENLGSGVVNAYRAAIELWLVFVGTVAGLFRRGKNSPRGEVTRQLYQIGNKSLVFIVVTLGFIGMVMAHEACMQASRVTPGNYSQIGMQLLKLVISDFGPTLTALMEQASGLGSASLPAAPRSAMASASAT